MHAEVIIVSEVIRLTHCGRASTCDISTCSKRIVGGGHYTASGECAIDTFTEWTAVSLRTEPFSIREGMSGFTLGIISVHACTVACTCGQAPLDLIRQRVCSPVTMIDGQTFNDNAN